ncbi:hypothetical protein M427DRAFT_36472 [Gonapodya prolifera JEL478]|uniref:Uncharacterized protein n=1 Tax=Gonapodya prolifera (strain JEL478) TaxID=1344416 RepID=A0A139A264_GONPJ|nr:hypothetical protein M427DRAFT_36472 [Gonapodya prolifera JEL478]|eukprot:KXS10867.1 hypothetical protein M427DRAFT_36472 [Gonapodya prolifera JEL478]
MDFQSTRNVNFGQGVSQTRQALLELVFSSCTSGDDAGKQDPLDTAAGIPSTSATVARDAKSLMKYTTSPWSAVPANARPRTEPGNPAQRSPRHFRHSVPRAAAPPTQQDPSYHFNLDDFDPLSNTPEARGWSADGERFPHLHAATLLGALRPVNQYLEGSTSRNKRRIANGATDLKSPLLSAVAPLVDPTMRTFTQTMLPRLTSVTMRGVVSAKSPIILCRSSGGALFNQ